MKQLVLFGIFALLLTGTLGNPKRSLGRGSSSRSSSSGSSSRRTSSHSVTSRPYATSRPATAHNSYPSYNSQPNRATNNNQPSPSNIGWNVNQNKPVGPPPAYNAHNPAGGARPNINEKPPSYSSGSNSAPIRPATQRPLQSSYPKQSLPGSSYPHNSGPPANAGPPKYYPVGSGPSAGYHPSGGAGYHPPSGGATYYPAGHGPATGYHPGGYGGGAPAFPHQSPPMYAPVGAVQPGFYPAGSFPAQKTNSGPGLGTGLIAGALGGAILGHALTPTHNNYGGSNYGGGGGGGHSDNDRVIIINNTPGQPATVTTQDGHPIGVVNNNQPQAPPAANPEAPVPLAPFQPGSTQTVNQPPSGDQMGSATAVSPPLVHTPNNAAPGQTYPDGTVPLAPLTENNSSSTEPPKSGGVMCYPVLVNVTSPTDPTNITTIEQIACYEVPAGYDPNAPQQEQSTSGSSSSSTTMTQKPDLMQMPGEQITQRTSTATLAESSQIKQNGALGQHSSVWSTITSTLMAITIAYCLQ